VSDTVERQPVGMGYVRAWARKHQLPVGERGHISQPVIDRFNRFHRFKVAINKNPMVAGKAAE
jgi:hypothetical protein